MCHRTHGDVAGHPDKVPSRLPESPTPLIPQTFFLDPAMADNIRLDGVVTLVDAKHVGQHLDEEKPGDVVNEALQQIAYADRIVLNKMDLVRCGPYMLLLCRVSTWRVAWHNPVRVCAGGGCRCAAHWCFAKDSDSGGCAASQIIRAK